MTIVNFDTFAALPEGTIFSYYVPSVVEGLWRKGQTLYVDSRPSDFYEASLVAHCINGEHPTVDLIEHRWGTYDFNQQFAIYEHEDLQRIVNAIVPSMVSENGHKETGCS